MRRANHDSISAELAAVQQQFAQWRANRQRGARIPARLWNLAAQVAAKYGVSRTKSVLQLDYYSLKKHLQRAPARRAGKTPRISDQPTFLELAPSPLANSAECVIEFQDGAGASLRIQLKGTTCPDIVALGQSFWGVK